MVQVTFKTWASKMMAVRYVAMILGTTMMGIWLLQISMGQSPMVQVTLKTTLMSQVN
jgi:hypothetical protein